MFESQEAESKPQCRRLQLKDIIPIEMQRLTKYPLLLENIAKNTGVCVCVCVWCIAAHPRLLQALLISCFFPVLPHLSAAFGPTEDPIEKERIQQCAECCRKILNHVNEEVKQMENLLVRNTQSIIQHTVMQ